MVCPMHRLTRHLARRVVALPVAIACAFILAQPAVGAPTPGTRLWATHDTVSFENSTGIVASPDGSKVFVTGNKAPRAYNASTGAKIWSTLRGFNNYSYIAASPDGSMVFVTGEEYDGDPGGYNFATFAYSASTGTKRWRSDFTSRGVVGDFPTAIVVSPDGSKVFVTRATFDEGFGKDYNTVAYNATTGAELWSRRYDAEPNSEGAAGIATNPDGTEVFVTGWTATVAYDAATGRLLWVKDVRPSGFWWAVASGGTGADVFVAGSSGGGNGNLTVVAYDARTGVKRWVQRFQSRQGASDGQSLVVSPDGSVVYVGGWNQDSDLYFDYETIAFGPSSG